MYCQQGYYRRTPEYIPIRDWKRLGCHAVPMVHSTFLLDLRRKASQDLAFYPVHHLYPWVMDDIMVFSFSARQAGQYLGDLYQSLCFEEWVSYINHGMPYRL